MKSCFLIIILAFLGLGARAQVQINWNEVVVTDSAGNVYQTAAWQSLLTSGKYGLRLSPDKKTGKIVKYSEEEVATRTAALPKPAPSRYFTAGQKIPNFSDRDINGNKYDLSKLGGKIVVMNFWFVNCPPCRLEIPGLNEMMANYKDNKDVVFIAIALDPAPAIREFIKTSPFNYNIISDGGYISHQYGVTSYPTHLILDKEGKVAFHTTGLSTATVPWLKKSIDAVLAGTAP